MFIYMHVMAVDMMGRTTVIQVFYLKMFLLIFLFYFLCNFFLFIFRSGSSWYKWKLQSSRRYTRWHRYKHISIYYKITWMFNDCCMDWSCFNWNFCCQVWILISSFHFLWLWIFDWLIQSEYVKNSVQNIWICNVHMWIWEYVNKWISE